MTEQSRDLALALSYLDDVDKKFQGFYPDPMPSGAVARAEAWIMCSYKAQELLKDDYAKALKHIQAAESQGSDVTTARSRALFAKGLMAIRVVRLFGDNPYQNKDARKWLEGAVSAFSEYISLGSEHNDTARAHYNLAVAYEWLNRKNEAIEALRRAESSGDADLSIEATKMIARLEEKKKGCYIATACYGSYDHPNVLVLRRFRDERLLTTRFGMWFVWTYYAVSPLLAQLIGNCRWLSLAVRRGFLDPLVRRLHLGYEEDLK